MPRSPLQPAGWRPPLANPFRRQYRDALFFVCALGAFFGVGQAVQGGLLFMEPKNALSWRTAGWFPTSKSLGSQYSTGSLS